MNKNPWGDKTSTFNASQQRNLVNDQAYNGAIDSLRKILQQRRDQTADTYPSVLTADWYDRNKADSLPAWLQAKGMLPTSRNICQEFSIL